NVYRNARFTNSITSVRANEFGRGSISHTNFVRASAGDLRNAGSVRGQLPFQPSRESTQFTNRGASTQGMPRTNDNTRFFSRSQGSQVGRVPFTQQQQSFMNRGMSTSPSVNPNVNAGAWRRAESPAAPSGPANNGNWQRFNPGSGNAGQG